MDDSLLACKVLQLEECFAGCRLMLPGRRLGTLTGLDFSIFILRQLPSASLVLRHHASQVSQACRDEPMLI